MFKFITKRPLWINVLFALLLVIGVIFLFALSLNWITNHGVSRSVPSVAGKKLSEVENILEKEGFDLVIQDSVYIDTLPPGMVIKQVPEADEVVKVNRTVYVTVNRTVPPDIDMPNLVGYSFRNAEMVLKNMGLKLGDTTYRPDFAKNSVLEQLYNGNPIKPGAKVRMGSSISLVIGSGLGNMDMPVPKLIGLTYEEAKILLDAQGLILVPVVVDPLVRDTANAYIYEQKPAPKTEGGFQLRIRPGQMIDVFLGVNKPNVDSLEKANQQDPSPEFPAP